MVISPIKICEIPKLVEWFFNFTDIKVSDLNNNHPLASYYKEYELWSRNTFGKPPEDFDAISASVIDFAHFIEGVRLSQNQIGKIKKVFVSELINKETCLGVFFEIRTLTHLRIRESEKIIENLQYRNVSINGKLPDFMFTKKDSFKRIFFECTRKYAKEIRCKNDNLLMEDLIRSLKDKAQNYKNLSNPFIFAVHVPEVIEFDRDKFRKELGIKLQEIFKDNIFRNVNYVAFSSYRCPLPEPFGINGDVFFDTYLPSLVYPNGSVDPIFNEMPIRLWR